MSGFVEFAMITLNAPLDAPSVIVEPADAPFDSTASPRALYVKLISYSPELRPPVDKDDTVGPAAGRTRPKEVQLEPFVDLNTRPVEPSNAATRSRSAGKYTSFVDRPARSDRFVSVP